MDLTEAEAQASLDYLLNEADEALISAFLVLLRAKGETFGEVHFFFFLLLRFNGGHTTVNCGYN